MFIDTQPLAIRQQFTLFVKSVVGKMSLKLTLSNSHNNKKRKIKMEQFYQDRTNDFENWYENFGTTIYKDISKEKLESIFSHAYTLGALQNSTKGN
jgi:hypothetical protein